MGILLILSGFIPENELTPVSTVEDAEVLPARLERVGDRNIHKIVVIKLNGGLGTSMGLKGAKSLLKVKDAYSFMDIFIRQSWYSDGQNKWRRNESALHSRRHGRRRCRASGCA